MSAPKITVLMPVYNGEKYLRPAIESILGQTYRNFEFLIIDDGSNDTSAEICRSYQDPRIRLVTNGQNLGLIATLNRGLELARGEFIARMDCDDISYPERLDQQLTFMEEHPEVNLCGAWFEKFTEARVAVVRPPTEDNIIRFYLIFDNSFGHNTIIIRRRFLERRGLRYDEGFKYSEDYELWVRCAQFTRIANIPKVLVRYRDHPQNTSNQFRSAQVKAADGVRLLQLGTLGIKTAEDERQMHVALIEFRFSGDLAALLRARAWLETLAETVKEQLQVPDEIVYGELGRRWYGACGTAAMQGLAVWRLFRSTFLGRKADIRLQCKLLMRCLLRRPIPSRTL